MSVAFLWSLLTQLYAFVIITTPVAQLKLPKGGWKPIITKQDIINAAIQLVRENGISSVNARNLAKTLNCSTKPLFRIYTNMDEIKEDIKIELDNYYNSFMESKINDENRLLSQGLAYI